jgi:hypothetical protein
MLPLSSYQLEMLAQDQHQRLLAEGEHQQLAKLRPASPSHPAIVWLSQLWRRGKQRVSTAHDADAPTASVQATNPLIKEA